LLAQTNNYNCALQYNYHVGFVSSVLAFAQAPARASVFVRILTANHFELPRPAGAGGMPSGFHEKYDRKIVQSLTRKAGSNATSGSDRIRTGLCYSELYSRPTRRAADNGRD
jgi:hypothetical protein